jgi:predicted dehydrogenase
LSNAIVLEGTRGRLEWKFGERAKVLVHSKDVFVDPLRSLARPCIEATWGDEPEQPGYEGFRAQIDDLLHAIQTGGDGQLSGESVLPTVDLIERCYAQRSRWTSHGSPRSCLPSTLAGGKVRGASACSSPAPADSSAAA